LEFSDQSAGSVIMASIWVESLCRTFDASLDLLDAAIQDCTDELWQVSMWEVPDAEANYELHGPDGHLVEDPVSRCALIQRHSTPWSISWHALEVLDYDLTGEFAAWSPPPPFTGKAHWRNLRTLPTAWSRSDMLGYVAYCRRRVRETLEAMTDEKAAALLPPAHRYRGLPFAWILMGIPLHTTEHASQIRQFITAAGVAPQK
jgi:DinB superfamily